MEYKLLDLDSQKNQRDITRLQNANVDQLQIAYNIMADQFDSFLDYVIRDEVRKINLEKRDSKADLAIKEHLKNK